MGKVERVVFMSLVLDLFGMLPLVLHPMPAHYNPTS